MSFSLYEHLPTLCGNARCHAWYRRIRKETLIGRLFLGFLRVLGICSFCMARCGGRFDAFGPSELPPASSQPASTTGNANSAPQAPNEPHFYIQQYRVLGGGHLLPRVDVEAAVYPYLGPYRSATGRRAGAHARSSKPTAKKVSRRSRWKFRRRIPGVACVIVLQVMSGTSCPAQRVHGSRYFSIDQIKREAPSLQEGQSPNFSQVTHDLLVLNGHFRTDA